MLSLRNYRAQIQHPVDMAQGELGWHMTQLKLLILDGIYDLFQLYVMEKDCFVDSLKIEVNNISIYDWSSVLVIWDDLDFIDEMNTMLYELELDFWTPWALH